MQENLKLLKQIGWQPLNLAPAPSSSSSFAIDGNVSPPELDMWRTLFDYAPCAIAFIDRQGRLIRVNRKFCDLIGSTPAEIINHGLDEVTYKIGAGVGGTAFGASASAEAICALSKRDGLLVWCRQTTVPCGDESKQTDWSICYFDEIRDSERGLPSLVESQQEFVQSQTARLKTVVGAVTDGSV
jgi:PAS domain-containing protein